jgi:hypothetical protein
MSSTRVGYEECFGRAIRRQAEALTPGEREAAIARSAAGQIGEIIEWVLLGLARGNN